MFLTRSHMVVRLLGPLIPALIVWGFSEAAQMNPGSSHPEVSAIISRMLERNREREAILLNYEVERSYKVVNQRFNKSAETKAVMIYVAPGEKVFEILSSSGIGFLRRGVINRIIETEQKTATPEQKPKTAISPDNYDFEWEGTENLKGRLQYVLHAKPRRKDQLLFDARIWVDADDYAVTQIEGRPAKNPSFWTRKVDFKHEYEKVGDFWLPLRNLSVAQVFLFGQTTTDLEYFNYRLNQPGLEEQAAALKKRGGKLEVQIDPKDKK